MHTRLSKNSSQSLDIQGKRAKCGWLHLVLAGGSLLTVEASSPFHLLFRGARCQDQFIQLMVANEHKFPRVRRRMALQSYIWPLAFRTEV